LIEVILKDKEIDCVELKDPHEHPESPLEMVQAIELARSHPDIKPEVQGLDASAILRVPLDPHGPSYKHRCMHVMFTEPSDPHKEMPVLFSALVDLKLQKVLAFGKSRCGESINKPVEGAGV
jgi:hypothetical protein